MEGSLTIYSTVQAAVDAADAGDTVKVAGYCRGVAARGGMSQTAYISKSLTLRGGYSEGNGFAGPPDPAANPTILDALGAGRVVVVTGTVDVAVDYLRLTGGHADFGGGVWNSGQLTLDRLTLDENTASAGDGNGAAGGSGGGGGGGIFNTGGLTVTDSTIARNRATGGDGSGFAQGGGGGLGGAGGDGRAVGDPGPGSDGGGGGGGGRGGDNALDNGGGDGGLGSGGGGAGADTFDNDGATLPGSGGLGGGDGGANTDSDGSDGGGGGGGAALGGAILTSGAGTVTIGNSTLSGNRATGGDGGDGYDAGNGGGGGSGFGGGIVAGGGSLALRNSTVYDNHSEGGAGGVMGDEGDSDGATGSSSGGGIYRLSSTGVAQNTIIAGNTAGLNSNCSGPLASLGYNLESGTGCNFTGGGDQQNGTADLGPLQDNGGPATGSGQANWTHALGNSSDAIDQIPGGTNGCGTTVVEDQRGYVRPWPTSGSCDVGSSEYGSPGPPPDVAITKNVMPGMAAPGDTITYTLSFSNTGAVTGTGVVITDSIPLSITQDSLSVSSSVDITATGSISYVWQVQPLSPGESGAITITGVLSDALAAGTLTNEARIACAEREGDATNNEGEAVVTVNNAPTADAGADRTVNRGAIVTLDGSGSSDPDGQPVTYGWTQTGGEAVTLSSASVMSPTFAAPSATGILTFTLSVTDSLGLSDPTPDQVVIIVSYSIYLPLVLKDTS